MRRTGRPRKTDPPIPHKLMVRRCEHCGGEYEKPTNEPWGRWLNRRYCGKPCAYERRSA